MRMVTEWTDGERSTARQGERHARPATAKHMNGNNVIRVKRAQASKCKPSEFKPSECEPSECKPDQDELRPDGGNHLNESDSINIPDVPGDATPILIKRGRYSRRWCAVNPKEDDRPKWPGGRSRGMRLSSRRAEGGGSRPGVIPRASRGTGLGQGAAVSGVV